MLTETFAKLKSKMKGEPLTFDFSSFKLDKVSIEKRKRYQAYLTLDYILSFLSYFDFFSQDTFKIVLEAKLLALSFNQKSVSSEFLLFPFLDFDSEFSKILNEYNFTQKIIFSFFSKSYDIESNKKNFSSFFSKYFSNNSLKKELILSDINYSYETNSLLEKCAENALIRFKTPIITPEILFLTLMEEKKSKVGKLIQHFLRTEIDWYILRYRLLKRLHKQESSIRTEVKKNYLFFTYLLKTQLSEFEFNRLIESNSLELGVSLFRNLLISQILELNLFDSLDQEIYFSMRGSGKRFYSIE